MKPRGYGAYTPNKVREVVMGGKMVEREDGLWEPAVPLPYYSWIERLLQAWDVFTYKADALYWEFDGVKRLTYAEQMAEKEKKNKVSLSQFKSLLTKKL